MHNVRRAFAAKIIALTKDTKENAKAAAVQTVELVRPTPSSPDETLSELFDEVQTQQIYGDGKAFVDMTPTKPARTIMARYRRQRRQPGFDLATFVGQHFSTTVYPTSSYQPTDTTTARQHVSQLWRQLERRNRKNRGSLLALPYPYMTPGGRFDELFYWDTYFIMLGLAADGRWRSIEHMMRNYTYMLRKFGMIPTANRTYFLSRSQPPLFAAMVQLLARHRGKRVYAEFLPSLLAEYRFWMKGRRQIAKAKAVEYPAYLRVAVMPDGTPLNRYYDNRTTPRPESHREDVHTAHHAASAHTTRTFLDLRAAAESGWDFSSRWFADPCQIQTIETTKYVPVDLNCFLYQLEMTIAEAYRLIKQRRLARRFEAAAERRARAIRRYCWQPTTQFFEDYAITTGQTTGRLTLAAVTPLYVGIATDEQAAAVAQRLEKDFLQPGGLLSTLITNGQQWDAPNGWAPLQWFAIVGLRNYGYDTLAATIRDRWLATNEAVFAQKRKMVEKYDVVTASAGGGGEYPLQDGFGWTNGVYAALKDEQLGVAQQ